MVKILHELKHHIPFTIFSAVAAMIIIAFFCVAMTAIVTEHEVDEETDHDEHGVGVLGVHFFQLFHVFHPFHVLFSATATTAMFWRFDKRLWKAVVIGLVGSLGICAASDIFFPVLGGTLAGIEMHLHICLLEDPLNVIPFSFIGIILGLVTAEVFLDRRATIFSHSGHIFISTMASLIYLVGFGFVDWMEHLSVAFLIVIFAVILPCCVSDIFFPLLFVNKEDRDSVSACISECKTPDGEEKEEEHDRQGEEH